MKPLPVPDPQNAAQPPDCAAFHPSSNHCDYAHRSSESGAYIWKTCLQSNRSRLRAKKKYRQRRRRWPIIGVGRIRTSSTMPNAAHSQNISFILPCNPPNRPESTGTDLTSNLQKGLPSKSKRQAIFNRGPRLVHHPSVFPSNRRMAGTARRIPMLRSARGNPMYMSSACLTTRIRKRSIS